MTPLDELNFHHLLSFYVVAREGSVSAATTVLGLAQPTISGQVRGLEEDLGERLFRRRGRGLELTEMGHVVFTYAETIYNAGQELVDTVRGRPSSGPMRFSVGVSDTLPKLTTWRLLRPAFAGLTPLRLTIRIGKTPQLLTELSTHGLDLVLADQPVPAGGSVRAFNHLLGDCGVTVFAKADQADRYKRQFPRSLNGAPFVLQTSNTALRRSLDSWFESQGWRPVVTAEVEDAALLQVVGAEGVGLFAAPTVVEEAIKKQYGVKVVGRLDAVRERFYAISIDRKLKHPAVVALSQAARTRLFAHDG